MKIGIDIRVIGKNRTGDETYTRELVKSLLAIDWKNEYFLYTDTDDGKIIDVIRKKLHVDENSKARIVSVLPASKMLWTFWSLPGYLAKNPVDVLHVQYITPQLLPKQTKLVTTIHDISFNYFSKYISLTDLFFLKALIPLSLKKADRIIGVSDFTQKEIEKYYRVAEGKVVAVRNGGASQSYFEQVDDRRKKEIRKKYGLPENFILYVGTLQPRKNIPFLLDAFRKLKETYVNIDSIGSVSLVVAGNKSGHNYDRKIDKQLEGMEISGDRWSKHIFFPGYIEQADLPALFQIAELFCFPSLYEGFGLPMIEAMASGVAVVCSRSSCHREICGQAAMYYIENDRESLVEKLYEVLTHDEKKNKLIEAGKQRAREFSWEKCAKETLAVYESLSKS